MPTTYDLGWILPYVRESLRGRGNLNFEGFVQGVLEVLARANVPTIKKTTFPQSTRLPYDINAVNQDIQIAIAEGFHYIEQNRFILQQPQDMSLNITQGGRWLITKRGEGWANGATPVPEDYDGFMKQFASSTTDPVVRQYVSESLNTYIKGAFFAAAVMLGAAAEKTIYLLAESLVAALRDPAKQADLKRKIEARKMEQMFSLVEQIVNNGNNAKPRIIPFDVVGGNTRHLVALFDHIRLQRNDAIHPMNFSVSGDSVRFAISAFPMAFERVEALRTWCDANPGSL